MGVRQHGRCIVDELGIVGVVALAQLHHVAVLILKPEQVLRLLHDAVFGTRSEHQRVAYNLEVGGHAGGVGVEDGVAAHAERYVFRLVVEPDAL